jgi:predicted MPP superfamily phosphohydrolase
MARRPPTTGRFVRFLRMITLATLPPTAIALVELGARVHPALGAVLAVSVCGGLLFGVGARVRAGFADAPRPRWVGAIAMPLFDWIWTASLFAPITAGVVGLVAFPLSLVRPEALGVGPITQLGCALALVVAGYGVFIRRRWIRIRRVEVRVDGLPAALEGYTIAHLSDLHIGSIHGTDEAKRWVARANALSADLVAVTGDLLSTGTHFHDQVVETLAALEGREGVYACLGNHDYYEEGRLCAALAARGVRVLRNEGIALARGLFVAGIEDAWRGAADIDAALEARGDAPVLLLAHNPVHFALATRARVDVTLSGHTHAGQVGLPFVEGGLARFTTRYAGGLFREGSSTLFVHAGLGTTGPAIRLGAAPEVVAIVLRAA